MSGAALTAGALVALALLAAVGVWMWRWFSSRHRGADRANATCFANTVLEPRHAAPQPEPRTPQDSIADTVIESRFSEPPRRLGPYLIERDIGRGAMGMVLQGRHVQSNLAVALKTMSLGREFQGPDLVEARERFFREADMARRLRHPDIVTVHDAGEEQGTAYIVMELLAGHDLSPHTQPGRLLPVADVVGIGARVAQALAHAHRQGVTHRDIKPSNIMVEPASGLVKVTDFGIARIIDSTQTRTGLVLGTPSFMSPEQMAGARVDGRSDLYALGVTLFQLLTGTLPHRGDSMAALIRSIGNDPAPDIRSVRPELPPALAKIVALALEKRPEARYADGNQLAADLQTVLMALKAGTPSGEGDTALGGPPGSAGPAAATSIEAPSQARHNR